LALAVFQENEKKPDEGEKLRRHFPGHGGVSFRRKKEVTKKISGESKSKN